MWQRWTNPGNSNPTWAWPALCVLVVMAVASACAAQEPDAGKVANVVPSLADARRAEPGRCGKGGLLDGPLPFLESGAAEPPRTALRQAGPDMNGVVQLPPSVAKQGRGREADYRGPQSAAFLLHAELQAAED